MSMHQTILPNSQPAPVTGQPAMRQQSPIQSNSDQEQQSRIGLPHRKRTNISKHASASSKTHALFLILEKHPFPPPNKDAMHQPLPLPAVTAGNPSLPEHPPLTHHGGCHVVVDLRSNTDRCCIVLDNSFARRATAWRSRLNVERRHLPGNKTIIKTETGVMIHKLVELVAMNRAQRYNQEKETLVCGWLHQHALEG
ncbi:hypothetical protein ACRALDRAFT_210426 [Sodiomyces alcalophilus JCM 7366]|uniref:uncharacterized protein n=1 Tax=Sodiomyces alcalophilus JCM 7366 TaxID=591952 RepID=UPI0039B5552A